MPHFPSRYALALTALVLLSLPAVAQDDSSGALYVGVRGGFESGNVQINWENVPNYGFFYNGTISAQTGAVEINRPSLLGSNFGLTARIGAMLGDAEFIEQLPGVLVLLPGNPTPVPQVIQQKLSFSTQELHVELLAAYQLGWLTVQLGPYLGLRRLMNVRNTQEIVEPANARFANPQFPTENDGRTLVYDDGSSLPKQLLSFGGLLTLGVPVALTDDLRLSPELSVRTDLVSPVTGGQWFGITAGAGLGLSYRLGRPSAPPSPPPSVPTASLDLYSLDRDGTPRQQLNVLAVIEKCRRQVDLHPVVYFESGTAILPERYPQLTRAEVATLSHDSLAGFSDISRRDARSAYYDLPNIVGARLRDDRSARIRLVGMTSPDVPPALARARVDAVRFYLHDVWDVDAAQIETATASVRPGEEEGGVGIETLSDLPATRLHGEWYEYSFDTPPIRVKPSIKAPAGVRRWEITFRQNDSIIARQSSDSGNDGRLSSSLLLRSMGDTVAPKPLSAELIVEDSTGTIAAADDQLPFVLPDLSDTSYSRMKMLYELFADASRELLRQIVDATPQGARVIVSAPGMRSGAGYKAADDAITATAGRVQAGFEAAGRNDVQVIERHGKDKLRPAADMLPEERAMMRGVTITIETSSDSGFATRP